MPAKQREMDEIVDLLFTSVVDNETLLIVAGDHGMAKVAIIDQKGFCSECSLGWRTRRIVT